MHASAPIVSVVAALVAGGLGAPIPEELVLISAGVVVARGSVHPAAMLAAALVAMLAGDLVLFFAGRSGRACCRARLRRLERAFAQHGSKLLVAGRFVPGVRAALLLAAGAAPVPLARLIACDGTAALAGAVAWIALGAKFGPSLERARAIVSPALGVLVLVACLAVVRVASRK